MIYLGPLTAAGRAVVGARPAASRSAACCALVGRAGLPRRAALVSGSTVIEYWHHDALRAGARRAVRLLAEPAIRHPAGRPGADRPWWRWSSRPGCTGRGPVVAGGRWRSLLVVDAVAARARRPAAFLFPPSHYVARTAAGGLLLALLPACGCTSPGRSALATARGAAPARGRRGGWRRRCSCWCWRARCPTLADAVLARLSRLVPRRGDQPHRRRARPQSCRSSNGPIACSRRTGPIRR